jgi:hypothetical protein
MSMGGATLPYLYFMINDDTLDQIATRLEYTKSNAFAKGSLDITHIQDTDPVGEETKDVRTYSDNGFSDKRLMRKVGSIPSVFLMEPKYKDIVDGDQKSMRKAVKRFFSDHPEFRTCNQNF